MPALIERILRRGSSSADWSDLLAKWKYYNAMFNITYFILWFLAGTVLYELYKNFHYKRPPLLWFRTLAAAVFLFACWLRY